MSAGCVVALRECADAFIQPGELCSSLCLLARNIRVKEGDLIQYRARNHMKGLLHIAKKLPALVIGNIRCIHAVNGHMTAVRRIQTQ